MSLDPRGWRRFDAKAWAQAQSAPAPDAGRGRRLRNTRGVTLAQMGAAWVIFALGATSIALAQDGGGGGEPSAKAAAGEGDEVLLARRNPRSGGANSETAVVSNNGNSGLVIRPSNTAKGGRAISATCDNDGTAAEDGCAVYVNKGTGPTASFRTQGAVPFVLRDTNTGLINFLNADRVDNLHASQIISAARTKTGLDAATADSATTATTAGSVGGVTFDSFNFVATATVGTTEIFNFNGLVLNALCTGATLDFNAETTVNNSQVDSYSVEPQGAAPPNQNEASDEDFDTTDTVDLVPDDEDNEVGSLRYTKPDGTFVHVQWHAHTSGANTCGVNGVASAI